MNVLFICPMFFGYQTAIKRELDKRFLKVIYCNEIPFNSSLKYYALRKLSKQLAQRALNRYNKKLVELVRRSNIDKIIIIRGSGLLPFFFETARQINSSIEIINYQWDSIQNNPNGLMISQYADKNFSFDLADCRAHTQFKHLPLFYTWDNISQTQLNTKSECDIFFVGTYHSSRHLLVKELERQCKSQGFTLRSYIYIPISIYFKKKIAGEQIERSDVKFKKLNRLGYYHSLQRTKVVLDIQSPTQTGATMRTIETLSMKRKLISTNAMLRDEKFYCAENIYIWNGKDQIELKNILDKPAEIPSKEYLLDLESWVDYILSYKKDTAE